MASFLDKIKVKTAFKGHSNLDFNDLHITTSDFFQTQPVFYRENIPGEKFKMNMNSFARLDGLMVPAYAHATMHNRAFFVPYRAVWPAFEAFITNDLYHGLNQPVCPQLSNNDLVECFASGANASSVVQDPNSFVSIAYRSNDVATYGSPDITITYVDTGEIEEDGYPLYVRLSPLGRYVYKILCSLNYRIQWVYFEDLHDNSQNDTITYNALPFFAYLKTLFDWYYPSQYVNDNDYIIWENFFVGFQEFHYTASSSVFNYNGNFVERLWLIFDYLHKLSYEPSYFTSAFDLPQGPSIFPAGDIQFNVPDGSGNVVSVGHTIARGTAIVSDSGYGLSQLGIKALQALSQYMQRHQLAGARIIDRYMARFGVELINQKINRALYLGKYDVDLSVSDVMSTANTMSESGGSYLGDYAGKGLMLDPSREGGQFEYDSKEYGIFFIVSTIIPRVGYVQGLTKTQLRKSRFDFFTPEYDALGTEPIARSEVYQSSTHSNIYQGANGSDLVFGWTPRYSSYKVGRDNLTGDFTLASKNIVGASSQQWHLARLFDNDSFGSDYSNIVHSKEFVQCNDADQYHRIFQNVTNSADHFVCQHFFDYKVSAPCKQAYDIYDFSGEQGQDVTINGNTLN